MGIVTKYASGYQDPAVSPADPLPEEETAGILHSLCSTVEIAATDEADSVLYFGKIPSSARISVLSRLDHDAISDGNATELTDFDLGTPENPDGLINGGNLAAAGNKSATSACDHKDLIKPAWELLGYTTDPGGMLTIIGTANADAGGAGTITLSLLTAEPL